MLPAPVSDQIERLKQKMSGWMGDGMAAAASVARHYGYNPRHSMSITNTKGLLNAPGENNCFLNSAVQVLWHLDVFRRSFRLLTGHACMGNSCIFCALKVIFTQFQYSDESALPPNALRKALAETFKDQQRFQLGCMDDAAECFENILTRIHFHIAHTTKEDMCDAKHCLAHQKFAMNLIEQYECQCGATSEPLPFTQMVHYVSATALCAQAKQMRQETNIHHPVMFSTLLQKAGGVGDVRNCPSNCGKSIQLQRKLLNCPEIVSIGLVWDSDQPSIDHIMDVITSLGTTIKLPYIFQGIFDERAHKSTLYLVGIVTYYGKHYSTFFFHTKLRVWIYFDDATVREIGKSWSDVVEKCRRGHYQPLLLLYADPCGTPISTETAPKCMFMLPGHTKPERVGSVPAGNGQCPNQYQTTRQSEGMCPTSLRSVPEITQRPKTSPVATSADSQSISSVASSTEGSTRQEKRKSRSKSRSRSRTREKPRESYDNVSVSSSASSSSADKSKTHKSRSKSRDRFKSLRRQYSNASYSSNDSQRIDDFEDLNTLERKKPFQGVPIPPDNRYGKQTYVCPKSPKSPKSPKVKRKGSFKSGRDNVRADIIRYEISDNSSRASQDSTIYNPYTDLPVKDDDQANERTLTRGSVAERQMSQINTDQQSGGGQWTGKQQKAFSDQKMYAYPSGISPDDWQQQVHQQWLNEQKQRQGDQYIVDQYFKKPAMSSQPTAAKPELQQDNLQQEQRIYYYRPKQQNQPQNQAWTEANRQDSIPSDDAVSTTYSQETDYSGSYQQTSSNQAAAKPKRMTPKLVKQRNTENKPSSKSQNTEANLSKRYRRKSLGGYESSQTEEITQALHQYKEQQRPPRPNSALAFADNAAVHQEFDKGCNSHDENNAASLPVGFATLPRKGKIKSAKPVPSSDTSSVTPANQTGGRLHRSASFHARSANDIYSEENKSVVVPTALGPMVVEADPGLGRDRSSNSSTEGYLSRGSDPVHWQTADRYFQTSGKTAPAPANYTDPPKGDVPMPAQLGRRDSGYKSGDRTSGSSTGSYSVDTDSSIYASSFVPLKSLQQRATIHNAQKYADTSGNASNDKHSDVHGDKKRSSNSSDDLLDFKSPIRDKQIDNNLERCDSLLQEAERLLDKSMQAEKSGDLATSLCLCLNAITRLRSAMDHPGLDSQHRTRVILETKHKACLLKSQSLHRKLIVKKQDPLTNSLYSKAGDSVESSLSSMVSSLDVNDRRDNLIDLNDPEEKRHLQLQEQLKELYAYQSTGKAQAQSVSRQHSRNSSQTEFTRGPPKADPDLRNSQNSNGGYNGNIGTQYYQGQGQSVGSSLHKQAAGHLLQGNYDSNLQNGYGQNIYGLQDSNANPLSTDRTGINTQTGNGTARQAPGGSNLDGYDDYVRQRREDLLLLENSSRNRYLQTLGKQMDNHSQRYQAGSSGSYGDLAKSGQLSRSSPNITTTATSRHGSGYTRHRTEQEKQQDVERQKQIILEKHKQMVAMQQHKGEVPTDSQQYRDSTQYPPPMVSNQTPQYYQQQTSAGQPYQGLQQQQTPAFTGNPLKDSVHMWYVKEKQKRSQQRTADADKNTMATSSDLRENSTNFTSKQAEGVDMSGTQAPRHDDIDIKTYQPAQQQYMSPGDAVLKTPNGRTSESDMLAGLQAECGENRAAMLQRGVTQRECQTPQYQGCGNSAAQGVYMPASAPFQRNSPSYCTLPRKRVPSTSGKTSTTSNTRATPTVGSSNFTRGAWSTSSMFTQPVSRNYLQRKDHDKANLSEPLRTTTDQTRQTTQGRNVKPTQRMRCQLCRATDVQPPSEYCHTCTVYLNRLQSKQLLVK